ncbi:hypothetical protein MHB48_15220 [Psychrobacillus sp. FSL H8-0483]|uniref:hypothetical protein n=1 Tax=Psychrobacillus sp. FSL H8-0483 TaxID=2921389 RepID=UPI003159A88A
MATLISTPAQLQAINNNLTASYELVNDIDLTGINFTVLGDGTTSAKRFKGTFEGKGYKIKNLNINRTTANVGLFGFTEGATIKNVGLENVNISTTQNYCGGLVGYSINTNIDQCYTTGEVFGQYGVGGLIGWLAATTSSTISNCFSSANTTGKGRVGGFVGNLLDTKSFISNSYAYGLPTTLETSYPASGLVGDINALAKSNVTNSYYNSDLNNFHIVGIGLTTSQFADSSNFSNWDSNIWGFASYPYLKIFGVPPIPSKKVTINLNSHLNVIYSSLGRSKRKVSISLSHTGNVTGETYRSRQLIKNITSHIDEIVSNVTTLQNANVKNYEVLSYIKGIGSNASRIVRTVRTVESDVQPIQIITDIQIPFKIGKPVYATVYVVENPTNLNKLVNQSNTHVKENATEMSVI